MNVGNDIDSEGLITLRLSCRILHENEIPATSCQVTDQMFLSPIILLTRPNITNPLIKIYFRSYSSSRNVSPAPCNVAHQWSTQTGNSVHAKYKIADRRLLEERKPIGDERYCCWVHRSPFDYTGDTELRRLVIFLVYEMGCSF